MFASNCEVVNLLFKILKDLDWNYCVNKTGYYDADKIATAGRLRLYDGKVFKLHGSMEHSDRKLTYLGFEKSEACALICTDVASRGLDFKNVSWVVQFDLSS